jgi:hypothetical protein
MYDTQTDVANLTDVDRENVAEIMDYDGETFPSVESVVEFAETLANAQGDTVADELAEGAAEVELAEMIELADDFDDSDDSDDSDEDDPYTYDVL